MIDLPESEKRTFDCPRCHKPILSRKGECIFCLQKFDESTLFSCPRCGALVAQSDEKCPGCQAPLSDSGIGPGTMTEKEVDIVLTELESLSKSIAEKVESGMKELEPEERDRLEALVSKMLELQISSAEDMGIRDSRKAKEEPKIEKPKIVSPQNGGRVNGLKSSRREHVNGMVNGTGTRARREGDLVPWQSRKVFGRMQAWQLLSILIVAAVLLASLATVVLTGTDRDVFSIDGEFSDWSPVPSYSFSSVLPEIDAPVAEAKISQSADQVFLYLRTDDDIFSGSTPFSLYAFVDSDANPDTGYEVGEGGFGADSFSMLVGWSALVRGSGHYVYTDTADSSNWSAWSSSGSVSYWYESPEIEMKIVSGQSSGVSPLVKVVTRDGIIEKTSPTISPGGSLIAVQRSLVVNNSVLSPGNPVINLSVSAMGVEDSVLVQTLLNDKFGNAVSIGTFDIAPNSKLMREISADLGDYVEGDFLSFDVSMGSEPSLPSHVLGAPATGYYISPPDGVVIDGAFGDWTSIKTPDYDEVTLSNPDIDIKATGASADQSLYYFYAGVMGTALGGANVPEERSKSIPSEPSGDIVRLRKTGEDLLQAFIDVDPLQHSGKEIWAGDHFIHADFLIEVYGRNGVPTSTAVLTYEWSQDEWQSTGDIEEIAACAGDLELSVDKQQLGNLSSSEIVFFTTDWKANSDSSSIGPAMVDPWAMLEGGQDYRSPDGISWSLGESISLQPSDLIVDIALSPSKGYVFAVTNTGRAYRWIVGSSTQWSSVLTNQITGVTDVTAIAMCNSYDGFLLTSNGNLYRETDLTPLPPTGTWELVSQIPGGYSDFVDLVWRAGSDTDTAELYALRATSDTNLNLTTNGGSSWSPAGASTGSSDQQKQIAVIPGDPCQIFVLSDSGELRYSDDSAASWSAKGDLPEPGVGNESAYIGISIDSLSNIWVITDTGFCFKSSDGGDTFSYTGRPTDSEVVGIVAPIPEFRDLVVTIIFVMTMALTLTRIRKESNRRREPYPD